MAKKNSKTNQKPVQATKPKQEPAGTIPFTRDPIIPAWLYDFKFQALIVAILAFTFYLNTFKNEYALDDTVFIAQNEYVYEGFAGIPSILTKDAFDSYYKRFNTGNLLSGGRYRPLSVVTFAIEQQFLGAIPKSKVDSVVTNACFEGPQKVKLIHDMHIRHIFNVLWFTLSVVILLYFLRHVVFKNNPIIAFLAALIFTIHPIHTEVVANVKSRDEILSLLFICMTFIFAFKYHEQKQKWLLGAGLVSYFLAFLSKEYAISLIILLPLSFYIFNKRSLSGSLKASLPYIGVAVVYVLIRLQIVSPAGDDSNADILNNPYALATVGEKVATIISTTLNYLKLLIFPHPLSSDYSYNTIPYKDFTNLIVWLSLAVHIALFRVFFLFLKQRSVLSFAIAFYLVNLFLINNIFFSIGATMGERLIYHSSVGFSIAIAWLLYKGMEMIKPVLMGKIALACCMVILICLCGFKTIERNTDWKNNYTLFPHDLKVSPNSASLNANIAGSLVDKSRFETIEQAKTEDLHEAIKLFNKAISIHNTYVTAYINRGLAYYYLQEPDSCMYNLDKARELSPNHTQLPTMYYNAGVLYLSTKQYLKALSAWQTTLKIKPDYVQAQKAIDILRNSGLMPK